MYPRAHVAVTTVFASLFSVVGQHMSALRNKSAHIYTSSRLFGRRFSLVWPFVGIAALLFNLFAVFMVDMAAIDMIILTGFPSLSVSIFEAITNCFHRLRAFNNTTFNSG